MEYFNQTERQDWESDEIAVWVYNLQKEILETIQSIDNTTFVGDPDEDSTSYIGEGGELILGIGESFVNSDGILILRDEE